MTPRDAQVKRTIIDQLRKVIPQWEAWGERQKVEQAKRRIQQLEKELGE